MNCMLSLPVLRYSTETATGNQGSSPSSPPVPPTVVLDFPCLWRVHPASVLCCIWSVLALAVCRQLNLISEVKISSCIPAQISLDVSIPLSPGVTDCLAWRACGQVSSTACSQICTGKPWLTYTFLGKVWPQFLLKKKKKNHPKTNTEITKDFYPKPESIF